MRSLAPALVLILLATPTVAAEFGSYDEYGYPTNVNGESTYPGAIAPGGVIAGPLNRLGPATVYPYYPVLTAEVQRLAMDHPDLVKVHSLGKSTLGLDLWMLEIADFKNPDMIPLEEREVVWVDGGTHSNEYSGVYFVAHLAGFLLDEYATNETAKWIVENRHTWLMPMVNPDGSNAMGRLNAHLVNINRNYPVVWDGQGNDALMNNRGPTPASEIETQLNIEWLNKTRPDYYASVHCCGNLWLYPYGEEGVDPVDNETFARVCVDAFPSVAKKCGPIWSTIYPASGSSVDTAYEYAGAVAFGYEMSGRGAIALWGQPFTVDDVETQEIESWTGVLHAFLNVHKYGGHPNVTGVRVDGDALVVTLTNDGYGNLTSGNASFGSATVALPFLAPNATVELRLATPLAPGEADLTFDYAKRALSTNQGTHRDAVTLARSASGGLVASMAGLEPLAGNSAANPANVPALALLVVLGTLAVVAIARRR